VTGTATRLLQLASVAACLIVIASFGVFAIDQTKRGSSQQQEALATGTAGAAGTGAAEGPGGPPAPTHSEGGVHEALDKASNAITSPFAGLVSGDGEWASRSVRGVLALLLYGFVIGFLVRVVRVRGHPPPAPLRSATDSGQARRARP
jgi:hypothetical protein